MKNYLLLVVFSLFVYGTSQAQLTSDSFDGYSTGSFDGQFQAGEWTGWGGGASNAIVTTEQSVSGTQSLKIWDNAGTESDAVALLGTLSTGVKTISFMQYIPASGTGAYYNLQHNYTDAAGDWAADVYFGTSPAAGEISTDGVVYPFTPIFDTWVEQKFVLDFTNSQAEFYYDGALIHTWVLNTNSGGGAGLNTINAINFYAANIGAGASSLAYYDDFGILMPLVNTKQVKPFDGTLEISPNPTTGFTTLNVEMADANDINVTIFDMTGKLVQSFNDVNVENRNYSIDLSDQPNGVYFVRLMTNGQVQTKKVVVNR
jgi:hypothetical protein